MGFSSAGNTVVYEKLRCVTMMMCVVMKYTYDESHRFICYWFTEQIEETSEKGFNAWLAQATATTNDGKTTTA